MESAITFFLESVKATCPAVSADELLLFGSKLSIKVLKKKEYFLQAEKVQKAIGFIAEGLVRSFYVDNDGNEINVGFYKEGDYATHYPAFLTRQHTSCFSLIKENDQLVIG